MPNVIVKEHYCKRFTSGYRRAPSPSSSVWSVCPANTTLHPRPASVPLIQIDSPIPSTNAWKRDENGVLVLPLDMARWISPLQSKLYHNEVDHEGFNARLLLPLCGWERPFRTKPHGKDPVATFWTAAGVQTAPNVPRGDFLHHHPLLLSLMTSEGDNDFEEGRLMAEETPWVGRYEFLKRSGYSLRPRYRPGWTAPWKTRPGMYSTDFEEGIMCSVSRWLWIIFLPSADLVLLETLTHRCSKTLRWQDSLPQAYPQGLSRDRDRRVLSPEPLRSDPRNHCLPVLGALKDEADPEHVILVMPWLRRIDTPRPASVRECVDFVQQTLEVGARLH